MHSTAQPLEPYLLPPVGSQTTAHQSLESPSLTNQISCYSCRWHRRRGPLRRRSGNNRSWRAGAWTGGRGRPPTACAAPPAPGNQPPRTSSERFLFCLHLGDWDDDPSAVPPAYQQTSRFLPVPRLGTKFLEHRTLGRSAFPVTKDPLPCGDDDG